MILFNISEYIKSVKSLFRLYFHFFKIIINFTEFLVIINEFTWFSKVKTSLILTCIFNSKYLIICHISLIIIFKRGILLQNFLSSNCRKMHRILRHTNIRFYFQLILIILFRFILQQLHLTN